jgi:DNA-binding response OmpR family regulator
METGQLGRALLLVEVDDEVREVIAELCESAGWRVVQVPSEADALSELDHGVWSALLAHSGTVQSGELLQRARAIHPRVRIVLMTAGSALPIPREADALLQKPFSAHQLREALSDRGSPAPSTPALRC